MKRTLISSLVIAALLSPSLASAAGGGLNVACGTPAGAHNPHCVAPPAQQQTNQPAHSNQHSRNLAGKVVVWGVGLFFYAAICTHQRHLYEEASEEYKKTGYFWFAKNCKPESQGLTVDPFESYAQ
jgi:hypothetical protein